jgi:hypothetical protein
VIAGTKIRTLGNANIGTDLDHPEVVDPAVLSNPAVIADLEQVGILHPDARLYDNPLTHRGSEGSQ